jgi:hypothetical protein
MAYSSLKIRDIVTNAVTHVWSVPEFQRGFVWKATQVRDLAESLWLNYPVGSVLIWNSGSQKYSVEPKNIIDAKPPSQWLVDGQQRATALCILAGRRPYWWSDGQGWNDLMKRYDVRFDIDARETPYFVIANAAIRRARANRYVPVQNLFGLSLDSDADQKALLTLARGIKADGLCDGMDATEVKTRLERICRIAEREVVGITVDNDLEEVVEIFARLNSKGTRVREADIYLGVVAARAPGWVRQHFMPFLDDLQNAGFDITPNLLFMCLTAVGAKRVRFKQVADDFWDAKAIEPAWERTKRTLQSTVKFLEQYGILTNGLLPSDAVFIPMAAIFDKFKDVSRERVAHWMLQALRYGRYSTSSTTSLDEDLREIEEASAGESALSAMLNRIRGVAPMAKEDFLRDYGDSRFGRLLLYLLLFKRGAQDWNESGDRIAFHGSDLVRGFEPQFHHVFPRKFLQDKASPESVEALANIAIIGAETNIRISSKDPMDYFRIDEAKRAQQFVDGDVAQMTSANFPSWLEGRADRLATAANEFLDALAA